MMMASRPSPSISVLQAAIVARAAASADASLPM
jgi:hypothetical protein